MHNRRPVLLCFKQKRNKKAGMRPFSKTGIKRIIKKYNENDRVSGWGNGMKNKIYQVKIKKVILAFVGILMVGIGVAWNAGAGFGNDPVGIFYDGIRAVLGLRAEQLGMASNIVNVSLVVLLLIIGRKYINLGTIIYILPYGACVSIGTKLFSWIFVGAGFPGRVLASVFGCILLYTGVAIFIVMDIGMDPMTGIAMVLKDRLHWDFKRAKWLFDGTMTLTGFWLGGKLGAITVITALLAGPAIQFISGKLVCALSTDKNKRKGLPGRRIV